MNTGKIEKLCKSVTSFFDKAKKPAMLLPNYLLLCSMFFRPGTSTMETASKIFMDLDNMGIPMGLNPDGSPNLVKAVIFSVIKNYNDERRMNEVIQSFLPPNPYFPQGLGLTGIPIC